jgi:hypothetical protein
MSEQLVDNIDSLKTEEPKSHLVKIFVFALILFSIFLNITGGEVIHLWIGQFYEFRNKFPNFISTNLIVNTLSISIIPLVVYRIWIKIPSFKNEKSYLLLLLSTIVLFVGFFVLGLEAILQTGVDASEYNPLLPSYMFIPRFSFSFSLLFILSAVMSFLTLKLVFRKKSRKLIH